MLIRRWIPLLALVAWLAIALPVGQKAVVSYDCDEYGACKDVEQVVSSYRLMGMNARTSDEVGLETLPGPRHGAPHWYVSEVPHEEGKTPLLWWGSLGVVAAAPAAAWCLQAAMRGGSRRGAVTVFGALLGAEAAFCAGVMYHSLTWNATHVSLLTPHLGALALAITPLSGLALLAPSEPAMPALPPVDHNLQGR